MAWLLSLCVTVFKLHTTFHPSFLTMEKENWATSPGKFILGAVSLPRSQISEPAHWVMCGQAGEHHVWTTSLSTDMWPSLEFRKGHPCVIPTDWMFENELLMNSQVSLLLVFKERKHPSTQIFWNQKKTKNKQSFVSELRGTLEIGNKKKKENKARKQTKVLAINYKYTHTRNYIIKKLILKYDQCLSCFLHNPLLMLFDMFAILFSRKKI